MATGSSRLPFYQLSNHRGKSLPLYSIRCTVVCIRCPGLGCRDFLNNPRARIGKALMGPLRSRLFRTLETYSLRIEKSGFPEANWRAWMQGSGAGCWEGQTIIVHNSIYEDLERKWENNCVHSFHIILITYRPPNGAKLKTRSKPGLKHKSTSVYDGVQMREVYVKIFS